MSCVLSETPTPFALLAPMETGLSPGSRTAGAVWVACPAGTAAPEAARRVAEVRCRLHRPLVAALEV
ncbi:MAG: hypothetical protein PWR11_249, partial [Bacillota bacterium]|nr:hypothetical protein [Bacillota bacterium]